MLLHDPFPLPLDLSDLRERLTRFLTDEIAPLERGLGDDDLPTETRRQARRLSEERGFFRLGLPVKRAAAGWDRWA
jgi:alkylation response protein AidB-like acyl-CoA dehydrogenase